MFNKENPQIEIEMEELLCLVDGMGDCTCLAPHPGCRGSWKNYKSEWNDMSEKKQICSITGDHPTELKLPEQTRAFREFDANSYKIHLDKNHDYSPANILVAGEIGILVRIWDKLCRLFNLYGVTFPTPQPAILDLIDNIEKNDVTNIESIVGALKDIAKQCEFDYSNAKEKEAKNEPIEDAWIDMATYSKIGWIKRMKKWGR